MSFIEIDRDQYLELEKIGLGAFLPLDGFMTEPEFISVVNNMRLPAGDVFPLPILLDVDAATSSRIKDCEVVDLLFENDLVGRLFPTSFFQCDRSYAANKIYGTDDIRHPGVKNFYNQKLIFVGGKVDLLKRPEFDISSHELTPFESKAIFLERKWDRVVGFQTRNVPHRAHEYLLRIALEHADGLFVQPLVGKKHAGDYTPEAIFRGYQALIGGFLPKDRVLFGVLSTQMRYAGPREAVFHAIVRRNYGCTHFIVGRDHAGVGDWYGLYDAHDLTKKFEGELGIQIMRLKGPFYCSICDGIATENTCAHTDCGCTQQISGTYMRAILSSGELPDKKLMRHEVVSALAGIDCFID